MRTTNKVLLESMVTIEVQNVLQDEIPKVAALLAKRVYEKVQKWTMRDKEEMEDTSEEDEPSIKKGRIYHLTETEEEDIRDTLGKKIRCFRCKKDDHEPGACMFGNKMCYYCNRMGHSYDDCVERMVTRREIMCDPYYDPWVFERVQYK